LGVSGDYLYLATDSGLDVWDVGNPASPVLVGSYSDGRRRPEDRGRLAISGINVYWAEPAVGLHVLDVSNPASPRLIAQFAITNRATDVAVSGNFAYVAKAGKGTKLVGSGLSVIDIGDPASPRLVGSYDVGGEHARVAVAAGYAYLVHGASPVTLPGLHIINVQDPSNPKEVVWFDGGLDSQLGDLTLSGNTVFLTWGRHTWGRLSLIDVTNPANPKAVGALPYLGGIIAVAAVGDYVYATAETSGLHILNLRPANPQSVARLALADREGVGNVAVQGTGGDYACVTDYERGMMHVIDIHQPLQPKRVGSYNYGGVPRTVVLSEPGFGSYAYVAGGARGGPTTIGGGLQVVDLSDPANPKRVGGYYGEFDGDIYDFAVASNRAYLVTARGFEIVDLSDPTNPRKIGATTNDESSAVAVAGQYVYTAGPGGLQVIDVRNPMNPQRVGLADGVYAHGVTVSDGLAYLSNGFGFIVIDITNPADPKLVGRYEASGCCRSPIAVLGHYAYLGAESGLEVIDIRNPRQPLNVGRNSALLSGQIVASNGYLFAAAGDLIVLDAFRPFRLEPMAGNNSNQLRLNVGGPRGVTAHIQRSTNLTNWEDWQPITLGAAPTEISDPDAGTASPRFYRGIIR
jgi:hypothetical protein